MPNAVLHTFSVPRMAAFCIRRISSSVFLFSGDILFKLPSRGTGTTPIAPTVVTMTSNLWRPWSFCLFDIRLM